MPTHDERCQRESTRDVVFVVQWKPKKHYDGWITESVWLDRDEADEFVKAHEFPSKCIVWQVYGVPSHGKLAALLKSQDTISPTNP